MDGAVRAWAVVLVGLLAVFTFNEKAGQGLTDTQRPTSHPPVHKSGREMCLLSLSPKGPCFPRTPSLVQSASHAGDAVLALCWVHQGQ